MREKFQKIEEERDQFYGKFVRTGWKGRHKPTVLITNIYDSEGVLMADHAWFNYTKGFQDLGELTSGTWLHFHGRVKKYRKGSVKRGIPVTFDYKLSHPSKVSRVVYLPSRVNESTLVDEKKLTSCPEWLQQAQSDPFKGWVGLKTDLKMPKESPKIKSCLDKLFL